MEKNIAIEFEGVGKQYRLGRVGTGTIAHDLNRWWQTAVLKKRIVASCLNNRTNIKY